VSARAAALLAALALAAAAPRAAIPVQACATPRVADDAGGLVAIRCDAGPGAALAGAARLLFGLPIDLNRADPGTLEVLPAIGPGRAAALVQARAAHPFCTLDDLARVPGFGPATRARLAAWAEAGPAQGCPPASPR